MRVALSATEKLDDDEANSYYLVLTCEDNMYSWIPPIDERLLLMQIIIIFDCV